MVAADECKGEDAALPKFSDADPYGPIDEPPSAEFLAMLGSVDDPSIPTDYARNSDPYFRERTARRHAAR